MASSNPRYLNFKMREHMRSLVKARIMAGEPCAICGKPIDLDAPQTYVDPKDGKRKRAPWSWEVDEIVPVSKGGSPWDADNVQPAHRICNQRAGAKGRQRRQSMARSTVDGTTSREW